VVKILLENEAFAVATCGRPSHASPFPL